MAVRTDEHRVVARVGAARDPARDVGRDPVRFLRSGRERLETDRRRGRFASLRPEPLDETRARLEPVGVVETHEPVRRVEDRAERAVVAAQDDGPGARVARLEIEDVVDRGTAERVDRLVVVAHDRHVPVRLGEQPDELRLGAVRVLELVDQQVPETLRDGLPGGRGAAHEPEGERDLVAEVDEPVLAEQLLVARVRAGELLLVAAFLGARRPQRRPQRPRRRPLRRGRSPRR